MGWGAGEGGCTGWWVGEGGCIDIRILVGGHIGREDHVDQGQADGGRLRRHQAERVCAEVRGGRPEDDESGDTQSRIAPAVQ